jgi:hypothetical protein
MAAFKKEERDDSFKGCRAAGQFSPRITSAFGDRFEVVEDLATYNPPRRLKPPRSIERPDSLTVFEIKHPDQASTAAYRTRAVALNLGA